MATRYSRFLTSRGTPTFIDLPPQLAGRLCPARLALVPVLGSLFRRVRIPQAGEAVPAGGVGRQQADDSNAIMQFTSKNERNRLVQRHPVQDQVGLLVLRHEGPVGDRNLAQAPGQEDAEPFGGDARRAEVVGQHVPVPGLVAGLLQQLAAGGPAGSSHSSRPTGCRYCRIISTRSRESSARMPTAPGCSTTSRSIVVPPGTRTVSVRTLMILPRYCSAEAATGHCAGSSSIWPPDLVMRWRPPCSARAGPRPPGRGPGTARWPRRSAR